MTTPRTTAPTQHLARFDVARFWDADSTPPALAALSRRVGARWPSSGARTPEIEAAVVLASLMHDVAYFYGGSAAQKAEADALFGAQIPAFVAKLAPEEVTASKHTALVDVAAVTLGGGAPFKEPYSWGFGFPAAERGYVTLAPGELERIRQIARETFTQVITELAHGTFEVSEVLQHKLAAVEPAYREALTSKVVALARVVASDLKGGVEVPGL